MARWNRFMQKVKITDTCWLWTGAMFGRKNYLYGSFYFQRKCTPAHRATWIMCNGEIPSDMVVCHKCDNPICVRASHLFLGKSADNSRDMVEKNRSLVGMKHHKAK